MKANQRRKAASRSVLLVALVALAGQLSVLAHLVLVQHVTCPEHGDLVDADGPRAPHGVGRGHAGSAYRAPTPAASPHGHDHCLVAARRREQVALTASTTALRVAPSVPGSDGLEPDDAPPVTVACFRLAPKTSPPA